MSRRCKNPQVSQQIAYTAAHMLIADPALGPERARRKAAERCGVTNSRLWPSPAEVLDALALEQSIFCPGQPNILRNLRTQALAAMKHFSRFQPHIIGSVLDGTANSQSCVQLYLFADTAEEVALVLLEYKIPWEQRERDMRYANGEHKTYSVFRFEAGTISIELLVLPIHAYRNPPLNPINGRPDRGANIEKLTALLDA